MRQRGSYRQRGKRSWRLKFSRIDPLTGENLICYETVKGDELAAKTRLAEIVAAIGNDTYTAPTKITVAEFLPTRVDQWEASGRISAKTAQRYRELVAGQIARHLGKKALQRLRPLDIERWHSDLRISGRVDGNGGVCNRTIRHAHRVLSKALDDAHKNGLIAKNVCRLERAPEVHAEEIVIVHDVPDLIERLHGERLRVLAVVALLTGMRRGELLALRWNRVDLDRKVIEVREALEQTKAHGIRAKETKSKAGRRDITLPNKLVEVLREHRKDQLETRMVAGMGRLPDNALLFADLDGKPLSPNAVSAAWADLADKLGIPDVSLHALRHSHASQLIDAGVDIVTISRRLGHASPDITLRVYSHMFKKDDSKASAAINAAFGAN